MRVLGGGADDGSVRSNGSVRIAAVHPEPVDRAVKPPPDCLAEPDDNVPETRDSVSGKDLQQVPGLGHLADHLPATRLPLGYLRPDRRKKEERQENQPSEDHLLEDHGFHGRRLNRSGREP
jgi:hypothetical protein